jgi:hypothetical protein
MTWTRWKVAGDTVWGIERFPYPDGVRCRWEIRIVGETAAAVPCLWGVWCDGQPVKGKPSARTFNAYPITFDRVAQAKAFVERRIVEDLKESTP